MRKREFGLGMATGALLAAVVGIFVVPYLGLFDMDATGDPDLLDWWGHTNWQQSLDWRAPEEELPASADVSAGLRGFTEYCVHCHGAPDVSPAEWAEGMQPLPPFLWHEETQALTDGELFRIIDRGVRMTGMPAFGTGHPESLVWNMVAAVRSLNDLSPEQRRILSDGSGSHEGGGGAEHGS